MQEDRPVGVVKRTTAPRMSLGVASSYVAFFKNYNSRRGKPTEEEDDLRTKHFDFAPYSDLNAAIAAVLDAWPRVRGRWFKVPGVTRSVRACVFRDNFYEFRVIGDGWVMGNLDRRFETGEPVILYKPGTLQEACWQPDYSRQRAILFCLLERGVPTDLIKVIVQLFVELL
jgi:hypothetical protein